MPRRFPASHADESRLLPVAGSVVAVAALAWLGQIGLFAASAAALLAAIFAAYAALRSMAHFICGVIIARPLLDLTADPRSGGVGMTEIFGLGVLAVSCAWLAVNRKELITRLGSPIAMSMLLLVIVMIFSALGSPDPALSLPITLRVAAGLVMFLVIDLMLHQGTLRVRGLVIALGLMAVVPLAYPLMGFVGATVSHQKDGLTALKSVFFLSNNFAHFLVTVVVVSSAWVVLARGWPRWIASATLAAASVELILTQTRGAWFGALVGVVVVGVLVSRRMLVAAAALVVLTAFLVPSVTGRITNLAGDANDPRTESSLAWRFDQWGTLLPLTAQSPLLGIGPDESVRLTDKQPHNDYLRALVETGLFGLLAYVALWLAIIRSGLVALRRVPGTLVHSWAARHTERGSTNDSVDDPAGRALLVGAFSAVVAAAAASTGENLIDNITFLYEVMPLAALLAYAMVAPATNLSFAPRTTMVPPGPAPGEGRDTSGPSSPEARGAR